MRRTIRALIENCVTSEFNAYMSELLFLEHQIKILPQHRKTDMAEEEMTQSIKEIRVRCQALRESLEEISKITITGD